MTIDLNNAGPQSPYNERDLWDTLCDIWFERMLECWFEGLAQLYEPWERYDAMASREAFLKYCADEFDRHFRRGPASTWPRQ